MRERLTAIIAIVLLASLACVTYWYSQIAKRDGNVNPGAPNSPDFFVDQVVVTQFDVDGAAKNKLFAEKMTHYADDDRMELVKPRLVSLQPAQPQLEVRARAGLVENGGEKVHLTSDVVMTRQPGPNNSPAMRMRTESLLALPDIDRYSTDDKVELERGGSISTARGMDFDNIAQQLQLRSDVQTTLAPEPRNAAAK